MSCLSSAGTSANALHTQVWTAPVAVLVLKYLQVRSILGCAISTLAALLRMQLFTHRDLYT